MTEQVSILSADRFSQKGKNPNSNRINIDTQQVNEERHLGRADLVVVWRLLLQQKLQTEQMP